MKILIVFLFAFASAAGQEGKAVRPAPKPDCIAISATESCTFRQYRFTRESGSDVSGFTVSRMESGNYRPAAMSSIFKDPKQALKTINTKLRKDVGKRQKTGGVCAEFTDHDAESIAIYFEGQRAVIVPKKDLCEERAEFSFRELDNMLK